MESQTRKLQDINNNNNNNNNDSKTFFVAVHVGAGYHSPLRSPQYMKALKDACIAGSQVLSKGGTAVEGVIAAISCLEDSSITNAGKGSNLTEEGRVECDASIMEGCKGAEGPSGAFGAVGAVRGVKNPIQLAGKILTEEKKGRLPMSRIRPIFLVGEGAREWAEEHDVPVVSEEQMLTEDSRRIWREHKKKLDLLTNTQSKKRRDREESDESDEDSKTPKTESLNANANDAHSDILYEVFDTVGAICIDSNGRIASGVSSGGISLKHKGRVGEAAHYGSGCWSESTEKVSVACSTTGAGEQVMKALLAKECSQSIQSHDNSDEALKRTLEDSFLELHSTSSVEKRYGGVIAAKQVISKKEPAIEFLWGHTTESMGLGYFSSSDKAPKVFISRLPESSMSNSGKCVHIGGCHLRLS